MNVGDKLYCYEDAISDDRPSKSFYKGKYYTIKQIFDNEYGKSFIMKDSFFTEGLLKLHFYTTQEQRKLKLQVIQEN